MKSRRRFFLALAYPSSPRKGHKTVVVCVREWSLGVLAWESWRKGAAFLLPGVTCVADNSFPQVDIIEAMVVVWWVRGKIIRSVRCRILCNNCAQCSAHTFEQTEQFFVVILSVTVYLCSISFLGLFCAIVYLRVCLCCVKCSFFSTVPRDWLGRMSPK